MLWYNITVKGGVKVRDLYCDISVITDWLLTVVPDHMYGIIKSIVFDCHHQSGLLYCNVTFLLHYGVALYYVTFSILCCNITEGLRWEIYSMISLVP